MPRSSPTPASSRASPPPRATCRAGRPRRPTPSGGSSGTRS
ncbi:hypothetical protein R2601_03103 [Salipiger bermudensis HTCC2601]|uniref:Uncharacterized protein n=1 Tax=Salipiger bermudensis (strain DSM 26914 / JCM 13377 / KCTC 12554 / HTCC2601) TaxID=314265 RepID=Q0FWM5_SALBH|nr:hypothetical protein R2601_03103 [Salipiger bermudensis HTCC2601]